jgi:hypothetical protein
MTPRTRTTRALPKLEFPNAEGIRCVDRFVSGRATVGATPRGSSGQRDQRKNTTKIEGFWNRFGCNQDPFPSTNGAAFDRWCAGDLVERDVRRLYPSGAMRRPLPHDATRFRARGVEL